MKKKFIVFFIMFVILIYSYKDKVIVGDNVFENDIVDKDNVNDSKNSKDNTIYVRNCYQNKCSSPSNGKTLKIDKTAPTCKLTANSSKISFGQKSTDVQKLGISKNKTADYTNATVNISTGKFYGYVIDKAGNTGSCNIEIIETSSSRSCSETCTEGTEVCDVCKSTNIYLTDEIFELE